MKKEKMKKTNQITQWVTVIAVTFSITLSLTLPVTVTATTKTGNKKQIIATPNAPAAIGPYSQAVTAGNLVFLSGQIGIDPKTGKMTPGGFEAQARQALNNQKAVLHAAGSTLDNVVQCQVFVTDMNHYAAFNAIYKEFFKKDFPARAVVEVSRLPADALVEIMMIAVKNH